jgi:hypothetical protein
MSYSKYGSAYTVAFASTSISTAGGVNLFPFQAGENTRVIIEEIHVGAVSSNVENLGVAIYRGSTTPLSTATLVTLVNLGGWTGAGTAGSQVTSPSSVIPSTVSAVLLDARTFQDGLSYEFKDCDVILAPSQRLDVVMTTPASNTFYGTMKVREIGKNPVD